MMQRKAYVDFAKFLAIFFVLANHIELTIPVISSFGGLFYVPIFFVLAGYTYRDKGEKFSEFATNKAKRLLIPYVTANLFLFLFFFLKDSVLTGQITKDSFFPLLGILYSRNSLYPTGTEENIYFLTNQNAPTWFLTAMFFSYLVFMCIVRVCKKYKEKLGWAVLCIIALCLVIAGMILQNICVILLPWSVDSVPFFALYMLAGYLMQQLEVDKKISNKYWLWLLILAFLCFGYKLCGAANVSVGYFGKYTVLGFLNGVVSSGLVLTICLRINEFLSKNSLLEKLCDIGRNTMYLMNYHLFVFMFFITACNLVLPGKLDRNDLLSGCIKFAIIVITIVIIQIAEHGWKRIKSKMLHIS